MKLGQMYNLMSLVKNTSTNKNTSDYTFHHPDTIFPNLTHVLFINRKRFCIENKVFYCKSFQIS